MLTIFFPVISKKLIHNPKKKQDLSKTQLYTSHVTSAFDCNRTYDREALCLIVSFVSALEHDPCALLLSRSTIQRSRKKLAKEKNYKKICCVNNS